MRQARRPNPWVGVVGLVGYVVVALLAAGAVYLAFVLLAAMAVGS